MQVRIHRGAREIGGSCVEIEACAERIVIDVGLPLDRNYDHDDYPRLPAVSGLAPQTAADGLLAVFISHTHPDHAGLLSSIAPGLPVYGEELAGRGGSGCSAVHAGYSAGNRMAADARSPTSGRRSVCRDAAVGGSQRVRCLCVAGRG